MSDDQDRIELQRQISEAFVNHRSSTKFWSGLYYGSVYVSVLSSAAAALVLKLDVLKNYPYQEDTAVGLTALAGLLTAVSASGGFNKKWRVNRTTRSKLAQLQIDASDRNIELENIRQQLKKIIDEHDKGITDSSA